MLKYLTVLFFLLNFSILQSQINLAMFENKKVSDLSAQDIDKIKSEMEEKNIPFETIAGMARAKGVSEQDIETLKLRLNNVTTDETQDNQDKGVNIVAQPIKMDATAVPKAKVFGAEFFSNPSLSFEPNSNMVTPGSYILGPGDGLEIVVYGMQEYANDFSVNKEGKITVPVVGQININGLSFDAAKVKIKQAFSRVYTSLKSGQSDISITVSKIKTIKVTMIGVQKPGTYSLSSLTTVFNALHVAGGPDENGTYRKIELLRDNKVVKVVDIYKFLVDGNLSDNINLKENDVIKVPVYENRVSIEGNVKRAGVFELINEENFNDLLKYCGGFNEAAYKKNIKLVQNSEDGQKIFDLDKESYSKYTPKLGDKFTVTNILNKIENKVSIRGSVLRPGDYELVDGMTILDLVKKADGFNPDVFKDRALLVREKEDLTLEMKSLNLNNESDLTIVLQKNDDIVISSLFDFKNERNVRIGGYIKNGGTYPYVENLTLYDLIIQAGGLTLGSSKYFELSKPIINENDSLDFSKLSVVKIAEIDTLLLDESKNIKLEPFDVINIRRKPQISFQKTIQIQGEVLYPGNYTLQNENEKIMDLIKRAGGFKPTADLDAIFIKREIDKFGTERVEKINNKIPIPYKYLKSDKKFYKNLTLNEGDVIKIEKFENSVNVLGAVYMPTQVPFNSKRTKYYINQVGGFIDYSNKRNIKVTYQNGISKNTKKFLFFKFHPRVNPGSDVYVQYISQEEKDRKKEKMSIAELALISSALTSITTGIIAVIQLTK